MTRYKNMFEDLSGKKIALIPFVPAGYPNLDDSLRIIASIIESGANAIEIGIPFSDPIADGNIVERASLHALREGFKSEDITRFLKQVRSLDKNIPIGVMTYANIVYSFGITEFYEALDSADIDSILIPDVPVDMSFHFPCSSRVGRVFITPHNSDYDRIKEITSKSKGFNYVTSRNGVTGNQNDKFVSLKNIITKIIEFGGDNPIVGFGISDESDIQRVIKDGAHGVVIGSELISIIEKNIDNIGGACSDLVFYLKKMNRATYYDKL